MAEKNNEVTEQFRCIAGTDNNLNPILFTCVELKQKKGNSQTLFTSSSQI